MKQVEFGRDPLYVELPKDDALYLLSRKGAPRGKILRMPLDQLDLAFFMMVKIAIGYAKLHRWDKQIAISDGENMSVREIIDTFGLEPVLELDAE